MWEDHGYQRSGRKCREKFENLYKYYKKTKEGKVGRQDGKHYRFFRQLEALCREPIHEALDSDIPVAKHNSNQTTSNFIVHQENQEPFPDQTQNSPEFETSSSINGDDLSAIASMMNRSVEKKMKEADHEGKRSRKLNKSWRRKMEEHVDSGMRKLMESQEAWLGKMLNNIEEREQERVIKEQEWREKEAARVDHEFKFWAKERKLAQARDAALLEKLQKLAKGELLINMPLPRIHDHKNEMPNTNKRNHGPHGWFGQEISSFVQLRTRMEPSFQENGYSKECLWEEIAAKMACLGYDWSVVKCKETWENYISFYPKKTSEFENKGVEISSRTCNYFQQKSSYHGQELAEESDDGLSTCGSKIGNDAVNENSFDFLTDGKEPLWENLGVKLCRG